MFYCRHMAPGVAYYNEGGVEEMVLIDTESLKKMIPSFVNKPVYVGHQDVNLETLQQDADGYVTDSFYNEVDGWAWDKFIIVSDKGHKAVDAGWSVSNAYVPSKWDGAGTQHNVPYDRHITDGQFQHLAIVPNPRYENAKIYTPEQFKAYQSKLKNELQQIQNSKPNEGETKMKFKLFQNTKTAVDTKDGIPEDAMIEVEGHGEVSLKDMLAVVTNAKKNESKEKDEKMNMDSEVDVDGEKMPLKELVNKYCAMKNKKNAEDDDDSEQEKKIAKAENKKENESQEDDEEKKKEKANKKAKKNDTANFDEMRNANRQAEEQGIDLMHDQLARGKVKYGSGN